MKNPPFELTDRIVSQVAQIAELVGRLTASGYALGHQRIARGGRGDER